MRVSSTTDRSPACSRGMKSITGFPNSSGKPGYLSFICSKIDHTFGRFLIVLMVTVMAALTSADLSAAAGRVSGTFSGMNKTLPGNGWKLSVKRVRIRRPNDVPLRNGKLENPAVILEEAWVKATFSKDLAEFVLTDDAAGAVTYALETGECHMTGSTIHSQTDNEGTCTVRVTVGEDDVYQAKSVIMTVTITKKDLQMLRFDESVVNKTWGDPSFFNNLHGYMSTTPDYKVIRGNGTADVNSSTGTVTIKAPGTAVIKVSDPGTDRYNPAQLAYILRVKEKDISGGQLTLSDYEFDYDGETKEVSVVSVTLADGTVLSKDDFTVSGDLSGKERNAYIVTVEGRGNYTGKISAVWRISGGSYPLNVDVFHIRKEDGSRGIPDEVLKTSAPVQINIRNKGFESVSKNEAVLDLSAGKTKESFTVDFTEGIPDPLPGTYEVVLKGLPGTVKGEVPVRGGAPEEITFSLSYKAQLNKKGGITIYVYWENAAAAPQPEVIAVYPLPEDETGSYVMHKDGTKEYLIFNTYADCMDYLGSDELCRSHERCYHK